MGPALRAFGTCDLIFIWEFSPFDALTQREDATC